MDREILVLLNGLAGQSMALDQALWAAVRFALIKGVPIVALFWLLWVYGRGDLLVRRAQLVATVFAGVAAIAVGRILALQLPFRDRPIHADGLDLIAPLTGKIRWGADMSAMPSDHAVLYFAIVAGLFAVSRPVGLLALLHVALIIALPRVILGMHWPSDAVVGAGIGVLVAWICVRWGTGLILRSGLLARFGLAGQGFGAQAVFGYGLLILATHQIATMFALARMGVSVLFGVHP